MRSEIQGCPSGAEGRRECHSGDVITGHPIVNSANAPLAVREKVMDLYAAEADWAFTHGQQSGRSCLFCRVGAGARRFTAG